MIYQFIQAHSTAIVMGLGYVITAGVNNLPPDNEPFEFGPWLRDTLRTLINTPVFRKFQTVPKNLAEVK